MSFKSAHRTKRLAVLPGEVHRALDEFREIHPERAAELAAKVEASSTGAERCAALGVLASAYSQSGLEEGARFALSAALSLAEVDPDCRDHRADLCHRLSSVLLVQGRFAAAAKAAAIAGMLAHLPGQASKAGKSQVDRGLALVALDRAAEAEPLFRHALRELDRGDRIYRASAHLELGVIDHYAKRRWQSVRNFDRAIALTEGTRSPRCRALARIGLISAEDGDQQRAADLLRAALVVAATADEKNSILGWLASIGAQDSGAD